MRIGVGCTEKLGVLSAVVVVGTRKGSLVAVVADPPQES